MLFNHCAQTLNGLNGDRLEWLDENQTQPTDAEIEAEVDRLIEIEPPSYCY
jgi:hypothetical protein